MTELVKIERNLETGIARLILNRPDVLNALDVPLAEAFRDAVEEVAQADDIRAIVLAGAGRAFVAGGDVAAFGSDFSRSGEVVNALLDALHPALLRLRALDAPVIAAVRGVAAGAGLSLVLNADLVVAEEGARFVIAYDKVGSSPDCGGTWFLPRRVGRAKAAELMFLGESLDTQQALAAGIVNRVVPVGELDASTDAIATRVALGATRAFGQFKRLADSALERPLAEHLEAERAAFLAGTQTADFREGVTAFLDKRNPDFTGK
jgi:2-(1,2-epoxy-1,2-dihydrophenyl)acetyl-CoA isomerase